MLIEVRTPLERHRAAVVEVKDGTRVVTDLAVASAEAKLAKKRGNLRCDPLRPGGHPPHGTYRLVHHAQVPRECVGEYGSHMLFFEPLSGEGLEAQAFGRLLLAAYGGPSSRGGALRRTQGGLRLGPQAMAEILARLTTDSSADVRLDITMLPLPSWWRFWQRKVSVPVLSAEGPRLDAPPLDEQSVMERLLKGIVLRRRTSHDRDVAESSERERGTSTTRDVSDESAAPMRGQGGEFAGGGATTGWGDDRRTAVDASGRIVAAAAAAGVAAAVVAAASGVAADDAVAASAATDTAY